MRSEIWYNSSMRRRTCASTDGEVSMPRNVIWTSAGIPASFFDAESLTSRRSLALISIKRRNDSARHPKEERDRLPPRWHDDGFRQIRVDSSKRRSRMAGKIHACSTGTGDDEFRRGDHPHRSWRADFSQTDGARDDELFGRGAITRLVGIGSRTLAAADFPQSTGTTAHVGAGALCNAGHRVGRPRRPRDDCGWQPRSYDEYANGAGWRRGAGQQSGTALRRQLCCVLPGIDEIRRHPGGTTGA